MTRRRVLVTGQGAVTAAGLGVEALWEACKSGRSAISTLDMQRPVENNIRIGAQVKGFDPAAHLEAGIIPFCDRFPSSPSSRPTRRCARRGSSAPRLGPGTAVIVGTGIGGANTIEAGIHNAYVTNQRVDPWSVPRLMPNSAASHLSARFGAQGPSFAVSSACASSAQAEIASARSSFATASSSAPSSAGRRPA